MERITDLPFKPLSEFDNCCLVLTNYMDVACFTSFDSGTGNVAERGVHKTWSIFKMKSKSVYELSAHAK